MQETMQETQSEKQKNQGRQESSIGKKSHADKLKFKERHQSCFHRIGSVILDKLVAEKMAGLDEIIYFKHD